MTTDIFKLSPDIVRLLNELNLRLECADSWAMARFIRGYGSRSEHKVKERKLAELAYHLIDFFRYTPIKVVAGVGGYIGLTTSVKFVYETDPNTQTQAMINFVERFGYEVDTRGVLV